MIRILFIIGSGSFIGGISRYLLSKFMQNNVASAFPIGTFSVNILGCFLIGFFYGLSERGNFINNEWRLFLTAGFCGGFTTFSTFTSENMSLLKDGNFFYFALYAGFSLFLGLIATYLGNMITKIF